ncbi:hypothetical protein FQR65_LT08043 [Abscondita terminalis]|nr:hypothetical protein FQR65_LT08043 [Abscondita terminalis]
MRLLLNSQFSINAVTMSQDHGEDFFRYEKLILKCTGIWKTKGDRLAYKIYSSVVIAIFTCAYYIILAFDVLTQNFYDVMDSWVIFLGFTLTVFVNLSWTLNADNFGKLLQKMGEKNFVRNFYRNGSFEHSTVSKWYRNKNIYVITYITTLIISIGLQLVYSLTIPYTKTDPNEWKLVFGSVSVVDIKYSPVFEIVSVYQNIAMIYVGVSITTIFTVIVGTLNFIATQLILLQNDLKIVVLDDDTRLVDKEKLKSFVNNHVRLLELANEVSAIFSKSILVTFLGVMSTNCLSIYLISVLPVKDLNSVTVFLEALSALLAIFLICAASDNIDNENIRLAKTIYEVNFVGTNLSFQKSLIIVLRQAQKPMEIKSAGMMNVSLITFTAILRIICSAYTMLKTVQSKSL